MTCSRRKIAVVVGLAAALAASAALPAQAHTKFYRFRNTTGLYQPSAVVTLNGLEVIIDQYARPRDWVPATIGARVLSGVYCTTLTCTGYAVPPGNYAGIAWTTADNSCRLRDLRWGDGQGVVPTQVEGVPGGGMVFYDYPEPGDLTVVITNDNADPEAVITLSDVEFAVSGHELTLAELEGLFDAGLVELYVAAIDEDIDVLRAEVAYYAALGVLPSPSDTGLIRKLDKGASLKHDGLAAYLSGDTQRALFYWAKAGDQINGFIKQVTDMSESGNLMPSLYQRWVVDGGGEITTAPEIRDALYALPEGQSLQSLAPLPPGTPLPAYPGLDPEGYREWPVTELYPGEFTAFVVPNVSEGAGIVLSGSVADASGVVWLEWMEQAVAEPIVLDTDPPVITCASATPENLWPPDHTMIEMTLEVTVSDDNWAVWYIAGVESNQPVDGTGDGDYAPDWWIDPHNPQSLWLRAERSGNDPTPVREYTITLRAIDVAGNVSAPCQLVVPVVHDQG